jgi:hypothetical protein
MAALLVYSPKCQHSLDILRFLDTHPVVKQVVQLHNINVQRIPPQYAQKVSHVPTLLTKSGQVLVGKEVRAWLESLLPITITNCELGGGRGCGFSSFDGSSDDSGDMFSLDDYGQSLQPAMTPELQERINKKVT